jgi:hypothetical protein
MPRAIGSAGDWIFGLSGARGAADTRRSRIALSVAIRLHIEALVRHGEAPDASAFMQWSALNQVVFGA